MTDIVLTVEVNGVAERLDAPGSHRSIECGALGNQITGKPCHIHFNQ